MKILISTQITVVPPPLSPLGFYNGGGVRRTEGVESTDGAIDKLVYELYGLSEEEIGIVEG